MSLQAGIFQIPIILMNYPNRTKINKIFQNKKVICRGLCSKKEITAFMRVNQIQSIDLQGVRPPL